MLSLNAAKAECRLLELVFDAEGAERARAMAEGHGLTQPQFDAAMKMHAQTVKRLFTPPAYTWGQRLAIAFHFVFNPRRWRA